MEIYADVKTTEPKKKKITKKKHYSFTTCALCVMEEMKIYE